MKKVKIVLGLVIAPFLVVLVTLLFANSGFDQDKKKENKYIGAEKCKNCHNGKTKGDQYKKWLETKHAKAWETLASDEAKKIAKERKIDDPQKSEKCIKCHITGHGEPEDKFAKGFNQKLGVQCESCHGPGEFHFKERMKAAGEEEEQDELKEIPAGEIIRPTLATCVKCHNDESPEYKPFCYKKRTELIRHFDPRKKRTEKELEEMKCKCEKDGKKCECAQKNTSCGCGDTGKKCECKLCKDDKCKCKTCKGDEKGKCECNQGECIPPKKEDKK